MSGLRDRMNRLRGTSAAAGTGIGTDAAISSPEETVKRLEPETESVTAAETEEDEILHPGWQPIGVKLQRNAEGTFLLRQIRYPLEYKHGTHRLNELGAAASGLSAFHGEPVEPEQVLFLDLETTGLGIGAGNVPFMVGIAYMQHGQFIVEQALIRHPAEERAMLAYIESKLPSYRYLATYNGRTFDWPVMQNRFIMNGRGRRTWEPLHLDFLHPSRSIWKNTLTSCKLSHVEEERLGIERVDDVPGSLAPQLYFQYLAEGDPEPLAGVFRHNEIDMLSLACLAIRFGHLLHSDEEQGAFGVLPIPSETEEQVRTGLWLEKMGLPDRAEALFALALDTESAAVSALLMLAGRDKKAGNWQRAVLLWQKAVEHPYTYGSSAIAAYIELAMFYEHKLKDYVSALQYTTEALELALGNPLLQKRDAKKRAELDGLRNRKERLQRKAGRMHG
ncbi:ribonuclease H-like domain-containing protein [Paenibacillus sp. NPDC058174]|uniref:ribonuclease H-like domain-containing protein n=1 Tax=Paenibacillus sp. NPDC058174 TaxID=3346366 RepID=UPI0036DB8A30